MTYRIMIVDDERPSRVLLKHSIDWELHQAKFVGEASSGIEGINLIDELKPDIIFVDIRMPFMDGIEFSQIMMSRYPHMEIIILTTYPDFSYAQKCIGIGVSDYVLKPIIRNEINQALAKAIKKIRAVPKQTDEFHALDKRELQKNRIEMYLSENYQDSKLNLTSLAFHFGFNPSYFSRKFKEDFTLSFVDYLNKLRMEQAVEFARAGKMMYQTAELVGIPDPNYFGKCFKKYTGKNYSDYVKKSK